MIALYTLTLLVVVALALYINAVTKIPTVYASHNKPHMSVIEYNRLFKRIGQTPLSRTALIKAIDDGPVTEGYPGAGEDLWWHKGDLLVVDISSCIYKGNFYLLRDRGQYKMYKIVKCTSHDKLGTFPPIFEGHETLIEYDVIGQIVAVVSDNKTDTSIQAAGL